MTINSFDLYLANRIQEYHAISIDDLSKKVNKSAATIRRSIKSLNDYLPESNKIEISDSMVLSHLNYKVLTDFIQGFTMEQFSTTKAERFEYVIILISIHKKINLTSLYDSLYISQSTKKSDRAFFKDELEKRNLKLESHPGKGITITGPEINFRILVSQILYKIIDIDNYGLVVSRVANTPIESLIADTVTVLWTKDIQTNFHLFIEHYSFNYTSKKFLLVYIAISHYRILNGFSINKNTKSLAPITECHFFKQEYEDIYLGNILACLDNNGPSISPSSDTVHLEVLDFIKYIEKNIITTFYTRKSLIKNIEEYIYKCYFRNKLNFDFYDNKLDDVRNEFPLLYNLVSTYYDTKLASIISLDSYQLSTLTLLLKEHVLKNKISGRNTKDVVVVTNSAKEKSDFFSQQLIYFFDVHVIGTIDLQEIHQLSSLNFDYLFTFSNRISTILNAEGFDNIKINYYLHDEDIEKITNLNFSLNSNRKLLTHSFVQLIEDVPKKDLEDFLKKHFSNFFI